MLYLPDPIVNYIHKLTVKNRSPAYILVQKNGRLFSWGGKLSFYGFSNLKQGEYVDKQILFLTGLLPLSGLPIILPCVQMESGISADVHIFSAEERDWVLLLDATLYESQRSAVQQKGNDLSLIRNQQARSLHQHFNHPVVENLPAEFLHLLERGICSNVTILLARICGFNSCVEKTSPEEAFIILNSYISTMIQSVLDEGGMVDKIMGDTVMTLFGVLPATGLAPVHAFNAALRMIEAVKEVGKVWQENECCTFDTGIGIASGSISLGIIGSKNNKTFIAVGHHVNLAEQLKRQARPREILIDENTFNQLGKIQDYFSMSSIVETGIVEPIRVYSYLVT